MCQFNKLTVIFGLVIGLSLAELNFSNDVENNKNFKSVPTTVKTFENDTVLLPCYHNTDFRYVRWHRDDVPLADSRHPEKSVSERIHLFSNGSLQVSNVQAEDTGDYYCEIMADSSHDVQVHAIEVQYAPTVFSNPSGVLELPIGAAFEVMCEVRGMPQPTIAWKHNSKEVERYVVGIRQSYLVDINSRSMSGPIECVADNGVGQPAVAGVYLNVLFAPEISAVQMIVYVKIGMRAHLECLVESAPAATIQWYHHGLPVHLDSRLNRHDTELQGNHSLEHYFTETKHVLIIKKVRDSDLGLYECRAENQLGFKGAAIEMTGRPMPSVFKINPGQQNSTAHLLVWQTESLSPIIEYKLKFRQIPSSSVTPQNHAFKIEWAELTIPSDTSIGPIYTTSYILRGLQPASVFEVTVLSRNHFGWSDNSKIVRFATGGEVELPNYSTESELQYDSEDDFLNEITQSSPVYSSVSNGSLRLTLGAGYILLMALTVLRRNKLFTK